MVVRQKRSVAMRQVWSDLTRAVLGPWPGLAVPRLRDYPVRWTPPPRSEGNEASCLRRWTTTSANGSAGTYST